MSHDLLHNQRMKSGLDFCNHMCVPKNMYGESGDIRDMWKYSFHREKMFPCLC